MADFDISVTMTGIDALVAKLESIKYEVRYKGGRFALRKAAQVFVKAAQANALALNDPDTPAVIAKNITERWNGRLFKASGDLGFRVGVLGGAYGKAAGDTAGIYGDKFTKKTRPKGAINQDLPGGDTRHWAYLEFGTEKMAARPFLRPAVLSNLQPATDEFIRQYNAAIERALARAAKAGS